MVTAKRASTMTKTLASASAALSLLGLGGCATTASMLSGEDQQNGGLCIAFADAQAAAKAQKVGTDKAAVLGAFGLKDESHLRSLSKEDVSRALYGQTTLNIPFEKRGDVQNFLNSVEGYSLACHDVHSHRSFSLTHTDETKKGVDYTLTFIFERANSTLYDPVQVFGTPVDQKTNSGYLQSLNPGDVVVHSATRGL